MDLNHRRRSANGFTVRPHWPLGHLSFNSQRRDLNPRPTDYKSVALPTELRWHSLRILQHIERICQAIDIENFWEYNPFWLKEEKMISYSNFLESMVYITFPCKGEQQWFSFPIDFQNLNIQRTPFKGVLFLYTELTLRIECG
jgi:hypothetical protein